MGYTFIQCVSWDEDLRELAGGVPTPLLQPGAFTDGVAIRVDLPRPMRWDLRPFKGKMPVFFEDPALVVRRDFAAALREGGVDNIDYYDVLLHDPLSGQTWDNYLIANVIGVADVIDMAASEIDPDSPPDTAVLFDTIVIDEKRCRGLKFFRPLHKQSALLVSPALRKLLESKGFEDVEFVEPEDYA